MTPESAPSLAIRCERGGGGAGDGAAAGGGAAATAAGFTAAGLAAGAGARAIAAAAGVGAGLAAPFALFVFCVAFGGGGARSGISGSPGAPLALATAGGSSFFAATATTGFDAG